MTHTITLFMGIVAYVSKADPNEGSYYVVFKNENNTIYEECYPYDSIYYCIEDFKQVFLQAFDHTNPPIPRRMKNLLGVGQEVSDLLPYANL